MTNNIAINTENLKENCLTLSIPKMYSVDFNKVNSFVGLQIKISEDCEFVDGIREYLVEIH